MQKKTGKPNYEYTFERLDDGISTQTNSDKMEEDWDKSCGPETQGGALEKKHHEMNDEDYKAAGDCMKK